MHLLDRFDRVASAFLRRRKLKFATKPFTERIAHPLPNPHRPIPLHVGMATYRTRPRSRPADMTTEQEKIHHFLNGSDRIFVLGQSHRPATDDAFASHRDPSALPNLIAIQATAVDDVVPGSCA